MPFYGRHRVYALFWTWSVGPFVVTQDIEHIQGSKSSGSLQRCRVTLFPRGVPRHTSQGSTRLGRGYLDVLRPNDWLFVYVDPGDGGVPEPLFMGFLDDIRETYTIDQSGASRHSITATASGWEKAIHYTSCITDAWVSKTINVATLFNIALRCQTEDKYYPWTTNAIQSILQAFLDASGTQAWMEQQALQRERTREQLETDGVEQQQASASDVTESASTNPVSEAAGNPVRALMGQFELPMTNIPLWNILKLKFQDLRERTAITLESMIGMLNRPLSQFIDEWSNPALNAIIYDVRRISADGLGHLGENLAPLDGDVVSGYTVTALRNVIDAAQGVSRGAGRLFSDMAPYIILMRRPLFTDELLQLEGPTLSLNDLTALNVGISDADHYNLSWIEPMLLDANMYRAATGLTGMDQDRARSVEAIRRHGLRIYTDQTNCYPDHSAPGAPPDMPTYDPEYFRDWNQRIQRAGLDQVELLVGSASIPKFVRGLFFGGKVIINVTPHPGVFSEGTQRVFYVDGIDWSYLARSGEFDTTIALTRGYSITDSDIRGGRDRRFSRYL